MHVGQMVRISAELASGRFEGKAQVVRYDKPRTGVPPLIWVRPVGGKGIVSIAESEVVEDKGERSR